MVQYNYEEVLKQINHSSVFGSLPGAEISKIILEKLGHPEFGIPFVHVAGTNGKGSVCSFLSHILMESGLKVGTFTSPHLIDFEERITVNNVQINKSDVERLGNTLLSIDFGMKPTMFDYCMAMALLYFKEQFCDIMIMETGLGGRLDSTNAIGTPEVTILTKIGYDHMAILGNTLSEIAAEKAGIIKPDTFLVAESQEPAALDVICKEIEKVKNLDYYIVNHSDCAAMKKKKLGIIGTHQWENAAAAVVAARHLLHKYHSNWNEKQIDAAIDQGLAKAYWPGRMEILSEQPFVMVDGAHNGHGVAALFDSLCYLYPGERFHFVMGVMADKDYEKMVEGLLPLAKKFTTVSLENTRALQARVLADCINQYQIPTECYESIQDVVKDILHNTNCSDKIIAFGSLYFIGELKDIWNREEKK